MKTGKIVWSLTAMILFSCIISGCKKGNKDWPSGLSGKILYSVSELINTNPTDHMYYIDSKQIKELGWGCGGRWSPDGSKIVYLFDCRNYQSPPHIMNSDGTGAIEIPGPCNYSFPEWSPDGSRIAYESDSIVITNTDGSNLIKLTSGWNLCWSLDGLEIYFQKSNAFWSIKLSDHSIHKLFDVPHAEYPISYCWSPDRTRLLFDWKPATDPVIYSLYVMKVDGSAPIAITTLHKYDYFTGHCWSPDGTKIAYSVRGSDINGGLFVINLDGSDIQTILGIGPNVTDWH